MLVIKRCFSSTQQFDNILSSQTLLFKCGNTQESASRFNFIQRWFLERKILNYNF